MTTQPAPAIGPGSAAAPPSAGPGGHHDWHSREYVGEWIPRLRGAPGVPPAAVRPPGRADPLRAGRPAPHPGPGRGLGASHPPPAGALPRRLRGAAGLLRGDAGGGLPRLADLAGRVRLVQGDLSAPGAVARAAGADGVPDGAGPAVRRRRLVAVHPQPAPHRARPRPVRGGPRRARSRRAASWTSTSWAARPCSSAPGTASRSSAGAPSARPRPACCPAREEIEAELLAARERRAGRTSPTAGPGAAPPADGAALDPHPGRPPPLAARGRLRRRGLLLAPGAPRHRRGLRRPHRLTYACASLGHASGARARF